VLKFGNKTANINVKKQGMHSVNGSRSKTAKFMKKVILLNITLPYRWCDGGYYDLSYDFCGFWSVTINIMSELHFLHLSG